MVQIQPFPFSPLSSLSDNSPLTGIGIDEIKFEGSGGNFVWNRLERRDAGNWVVDRVCYGEYFAPLFILCVHSFTMFLCFPLL